MQSTHSGVLLKIEIGPKYMLETKRQTAIRCEGARIVAPIGWGSWGGGVPSPADKGVWGASDGLRSLLVGTMH